MPTGDSTSWQRSTSGLKIWSRSLPVKTSPPPRALCHDEISHCQRRRLWCQSRNQPRHHEAHEHGILTSTSLLVDSPGSKEAAVLSRSAPTLSVGLHVHLRNNGDPANADSRARLRAALDDQFRRFQEL